MAGGFNDLLRLNKKVFFWNEQNKNDVIGRAYVWSGWEEATPTSWLSQISSFEVSQSNRQENLSERCHFFVNWFEQSPVDGRSLLYIADCPTYRGYFTSHEILDENPVLWSILIDRNFYSDRKSLSVFFPLDLPRNFWQISRDIMTDLMSLCGALSQTELAPGDQNLPKFGLVLYKVGPAYNGKKWRFFIYFLTNYQWPKINGYTPEI